VHRRQQQSQQEHTANEDIFRLISTRSAFKDALDGLKDVLYRLEKGKTSLSLDDRDKILEHIPTRDLPDNTPTFEQIRHLVLSGQAYFAGNQIRNYEAHEGVMLISCLRPIYPIINCCQLFSIVNFSLAVKPKTSSETVKGSSNEKNRAS
jgi:hypothetical protein